MADNDALDAALAQFNEGLKTQQAEEAAQRAVDKAERKKQQAAAELKKLQSNADAPAEDKAAAEEAYRAAVDEFNKLRSGDAIEDDADAEAEAPADDADAEAEEHAVDAADAEAAAEEPAADAADVEAPAEEPEPAE